MLKDIHLLASTYHWAEREILSLAIPRREAYLLQIEQERDAALLPEPEDHQWQ